MPTTVNNIDFLIGKRVDEIFVSINDDLLIFICEGRKYKFYHEQDCCESVYIADICGDLKSLLGEPLLVAEEICYENNEMPVDVKKEEEENIDVSFTWTFYRFANRRSEVVVRWVGQSNGYYSESVEHCEVVN